MKKDVIIIGAGPVGLAFAVSLAKLDLNIVIVEKQDENFLALPSYDGREIALTHLSKSILKQIGVWNELQKNELSFIKEAKVLDGYSPYAMHFDYREVCGDTLGYITSNHKIRKILYKTTKLYENITLLCDVAIEEINTNKKEGTIVINGKSIYASLIVAADSRFSETRRNIGISTKMRDFARVAILCKMNHESSHFNVAYECFCYGETLAVLPLFGKTSSIVITVSSDRAPQILKQNPSIFNQEVTAKFSERFGKMELLSDRFSYPLVATYADKFIAERFALIGDAAVGMHPVTAHGFNLGLEGQNALVKQIKKVLLGGKDIATDSVLTKYNIQHKLATKPLYLITNALVSLYTDDRMIPKLLRKILLRTGNFITPARKAIMRKLTEI